MELPVSNQINLAEKKKLGVRSRMVQFLYPYKLKFTGALLAMVVYGATDGIVPFLIRSILDDVFGQNNPDMLYVLPIFVVMFALVRGTFGFLQSYLSTCVGHNIVRDIRNKIHEHLLTLSASYFDKNGTGNLISRITNDTLVVRYAITDVMVTALRESVRIVSLLCAAIYLDPVLGFIAFLVFPLGILPVLKFGKKVRKLSRVGQDQFGGLTGVLNESILGHRVVQAFHREDYEAQKFGVENEILTKTFRRSERYGACQLQRTKF
jgi:subfamily B ATP-binding cassette protein MsbA